MMALITGGRLSGPPLRELPRVQLR